MQTLREMMQKQDQTQSEEKPKVKKEKEKPPTKEELRAAVASVVLTELEMWPQAIQVLIGEDHPNEESFDRGVPYIIGAYMNIARKKAVANFDRQETEIGKAAAIEIGPVAVQLQDRMKEIRASQEQQIEKLNKEEKLKISEAVSAIQQEYEQMRSMVRAEENPDDVKALCFEKGKLEAEHDQEVKAVRVKRSLLMKKIEVIEDSSGDWNSKGRKARRKAHRQSKKSEVTSKA
jgi:hypothetical protein